MAERISKSKHKAIGLVQELMNVITSLEAQDKRTTTEIVRLLRAGCACTVYNGNAEFEGHIVGYPGLDTGEALLSLSNQLVDHDHRFVLDDIYREFK